MQISGLREGRAPNSGPSICLRLTHHKTAVRVYSSSDQRRSYSVYIDARSARNRARRAIPVLNARTESEPNRASLPQPPHRYLYVYLFYVRLYSIYDVEYKYVYTISMMRNIYCFICMYIFVCKYSMYLYICL
jgi:hypothetical protein